MTDETGELEKTASRDQEEILIGEYDLDELAAKRLEWGLFRDRRPEMYGIIAGQKIRRKKTDLLLNIYRRRVFSN